MKLNNHGWGMRDMIIYTCILFFLLIFVAISINSLYEDLEKSKNNSDNNQEVVIDDNNYEEPIVDNDIFDIDYNYYYNLEDKVKSATLKYMNDNRYDLSNNILNVSLDTLVNLNYIEKLYDDKGISECSGYSNVTSNGENNYSVISRISCGNYTTEGY